MTISQRLWRMRELWDLFEAAWAGPYMYILMWQKPSLETHRLVCNFSISVATIVCKLEPMDTPPDSTSSLIHCIEVHGIQLESYARVPLPFPTIHSKPKLMNSTHAWGGRFSAADSIRGERYHQVSRPSSQAPKIWRTCKHWVAA